MTFSVGLALIGVSAALSYTYIAGLDYAKALRADRRPALYASIAAWRSALRPQADRELELKRQGYLIGLLAVAISAALVVGTAVAG